MTYELSKERKTFIQDIHQRRAGQRMNDRNTYNAIK